MLGLPPVYWRIIVGRWMNRAFVCRYGGQDIYRILGRNPDADPLSSLEMSIFGACLEEHVMAERKPYDEVGIPVPERTG